MGIQCETEMGFTNFIPLLFIDSFDGNTSSSDLPCREESVSSDSICAGVYSFWSLKIVSYYSCLV